MSSLGGQKTVVMPPTTMAAIEEVANEFLAMLAPEMLTAPMALDVVRLIEHDLPSHGIHVVPASATEMQDCLGVTDCLSSPTEITILLREDEWSDLFRDDGRANQPRATVGHELGHTVLHAKEMRKHAASGDVEKLLPRHDCNAVPSYMDAEWQAFAFAGCILAPRRTIEMVEDPTIRKLAAVYRVSVSLMQKHLGRLKLNVPS